MTRKIIHAISLLAFFVASTGLVFYTFPEVLAVINVKIVKDKDSDTWRVRDLNDKNMGTIMANKNDQIQWKAEGSDMVFSFAKPVAEYFDYEEGLFEGDSTVVDNNSHLKLTIKEGAPSDTLVYKVWVISADTFAVGNSHPKIIIN